MSARLAERYWTADELVLRESRQTATYELIGNQIYAMTGFSRAHY